MRLALDKLKIINIVNQQRTGAWRGQARRVNAYALLLVLKGWVKIDEQGVEESLSGHGLYVIAPKTRFRLSSLASGPVTEYYLIYFTTGQPGFEIRKGRYDLSQSPHFRLRLQQILQEQRNKKPYYIEKKRAGLADLIIDLKRMENSKVQVSAGQSLPVAKAVNYMHAHLSERYKIPALLDGAQYSLVHFYRLFKAETGFSPRQYLLRARVRKARELLLESPLNMSQIADQCGYADVFDFSRRFRIATGYSPSEFRKASKT